MLAVGPHSKGATGLGFVWVSFISYHPLCLLGITGIFFISRHHSEMLVWQTRGEAVLSRAIIQPWQLLNSRVCCRSSSTPLRGADRGQGGGYTVRKKGGVEAPGATARASVVNFCALHTGRGANDYIHVTYVMHVSLETPQRSIGMLDTVFVCSKIKEGKTVGKCPWNRFTARIIWYCESLRSLSLNPSDPLAVWPELAL